MKYKANKDSSELQAAHKGIDSGHSYPLTFDPSIKKQSIMWMAAE